MTTNQTIKTNRSVYDTCDPQYLRALREAAGMDVFVLARTACLSVAQVRQLETEASDNFFYSDAIKRQAYKRLLMILGAEPPTVELPEVLRDAEKVAAAHLNTLDQIVGMSEQPAMHRAWSDVFRTGFVKLSAHPRTWGVLSLVVVAVVLLVMNHTPTSGDAVAASVHASEVEKVTTPEAAPVASSPVIASSSPAVAAPIAAASANASGQVQGCAYASGAMPELTAFVARKEGRYVHLVSPSNVDVCVVDGNQQATTLQLKAGEGRSVYGVSPWQVSSAHLQKIQIYFQGGRVTLPDADVTQVKLIEAPVAR